VKVEICLFATLGRYLPPGASGDRATLEVPEHTTVGEVMASLHVPDDLERLQVVNGGDAPPNQVLRDGDILSAFPPLAGGA
jgi:molybdopterin converting factor small subunit